jgi:sugar lactone lactonase YvrE/DNA-binding IclR family transcriptional regulator
MQPTQSSDTAATADDAAAPAAGAGVLEKAMGLLNIVSAAGQPMTFTDLLHASGLPRATLHRILGTLVREGLLRQTQGRRTFQLGFRLLELAHQVWSDFDLRLAGQDALDRLRDTVAETVLLVVASGTQSLVVASAQPGGVHGSAVSRLGQREPLSASAAGLAILCGSDPARQEAVLEHLGQADDAALRRELALGRARGYVWMPARDERGEAAIAAPVFDVEGRAVAAVSVAAPGARLEASRAHSLSASVIGAARTITHNAGGQAMSIAPRQGPVADSPSTLRCLGEARALLGEGPVWSSRDNALYWVDILAPALHVLRTDGPPEAGISDVHRLGTMISLAVPRASGGLLVATPGGLMTWDGAEGTMTPFAHPEAGRHGQRYNDGKCDRLGRLWIGSMDMGAAPHRGHLYRVDPDGQWSRMDSGFTVPNGLGFSPDDRRMYFTDTDRHTVYEYDFDLSAGTIRDRRPLIRLNPADGKPDGLTVDAEGCLWIAVWDGWHLARYSPRGELMQRVRLPVPRPTSCSFGGLHLRTLYVTSARVRLDTQALADAPLSGALFALDIPGVQGLPETVFAA